MKNFVQAGEHISISAAADTLSGAPVLAGSLFGIAQGAALSGETVTIVRRGVFNVAKATGQAWTVGDKIYWSTANSDFTTTASGNKLVGVVVQAAASGDVEGVVLLDGAAR